MDLPRDYWVAHPTEASHMATLADRADGWIYYYGARIYDNNINRFISADTVVPSADNPQALNRYAYVLNNPIRHTDKTGHADELGGELEGDLGGGGGGFGDGVFSASGNTGDTPAVPPDPAVVPGNSGVVDPTTGNSGGLNPGTGDGGILNPGTGNSGGLNPGTGDSGLNSPDFVVTKNGVAVPIPDNATGPSPVKTGLGFQYNDGTGGGKGLNDTVTDVRIMDPTLPGRSSPGYPDGYASYSNSEGGGQTVDPYSGKTLSPSDPAWHIPLQ